MVVENRFGKMAQFTKVIGRMAKQLAVADLYIQMVTFTMENVKTKRHTAMAITQTLTAQYMKDTG